MFGLGKIFYVSLLLINSVAILNEDRFLARIGWSSNSGNPNFGTTNQFHHDPSISPNGQSVKEKIINLIGAVRTLMRIPLIGLNIVVIIYELILG
ncbi:Yos1-like protein [Phakopsora pachyrhizi]|uniref:Yos1-like protein n=1 Tax=Phakopsora pachyrhizi TaxID=170000 RepID=A0AAV0BJ37_PHAPC|nr:Yos1-like protein [Phakopsora pachyrhizi]CAH7681254.1 Yos1-like protein [Phakopsora pachyrhizi]CAH7686561.1 Yos1-like protein [Phakopsora pachyrhizi]